MIESSNKPMVSKPHRKALLLSYFTVGYNVLEGGASIVAGSFSGSIALLGFGLDSFVESLSGCIMIWRFGQQGRLSEVEEERIEKRAAKAVAYTFFLLGAYVLYGSCRKLYLHEAVSPSLPGIVIAVISLVAMPILFYLKYKTGKSMNSKSLIADSKQTLTCMLMSAAVLLGLGLNYYYGLWQADPIAGLAIVLFLLGEGYETLREGTSCDC